MQDEPVEALVEVLNKEINSPLTSSCGRLFDAVAAICGIRKRIRYEAQAAIELMQHSESIKGNIFPYELSGANKNISPMIRQITREIMNGTSVSEIGSRFHSTLVQLFGDVAREARKSSGINRIVLSGGVFQNEILLSGLLLHLSESGFDVYCHKQVPANDGGISLGQAVITRMLEQHGMTRVDYKKE